MIIEKTTKKYNKMKSETTIPELPPFLIPGQDDGTKIVDAEYHTLFICDQEAVIEEAVVSKDGQEYNATIKTIPEHKKYILYIEAFAHQNNQLHKILQELRKGQEYDILEIRIDSPGGSVSEGITIYNTMRELFNERTTTYLDSSGFSMGAILFSLGDERVSYESSSLMYHNYSTGFYGKGSEIKSYVDFEDKHIDKFFRNKIVKSGFLTEQEYDEMRIGRDFWFDSYEMAKRGICTHVIVSGYKLDSEAYIEFHDQDKDIDEWVVDKLVELAEVENEEEPVEKETTKSKSKSKKKS